MGILEKKLENEINKNLKINQRLWSANSGKAYQGQLVKVNGRQALINLRVFTGMDTGFPDMVGFESIEITHDMVGKKVAVFVGSEIKASKGEKLSKKQIDFKNLLIKMGGIHREHRPKETIENGFYSS